MRRNTTSIQQLVEQGLYQEALSVEADSDLTCLSWRIGALSFTGDLQGMEAGLKKLEGLDDLARDRARFFAVLLYARLSLYEKARNYCGELGANFYGAQARGFFAFFEGRFSVALEEATSALGFATSAYERHFALDLRGHSLVAKGQLIEGLATLEEVRLEGERRGLVGQARATGAAILGIKSEFGVELVETLEQMDQLIADSALQDFYSLSQLLIDRGRAFVLQGDLKRAQELSRLAALTLYRTQNRRQTIQLNLLLARLAALKGDYLQAMGLVETNIKLCHAEVDRVMLNKNYGMLADLMHDLKGHPWAERVFQGEFGPEVIEKKLESLVLQTERTLGFFHERRRQRMHSLSLKGTESDPLGELMDRLAYLTTHHDEGLERQLLGELINEKLYGLIARLPNFHHHRELIALNWPSGRMTSVFAGQVNVSPLALSREMERALLWMEQGPLSKEEAINHCYGYQYDPIIHDPLIYGLMGKIRKALGRNHSMLSLSERGYELPQGIKILTRVRNQSLIQRKSEKPEHTHQLNARQLELLDRLAGPKFESIGPREYRERHGISRITATRDLAELCNAGYLVSLGRARGVRYRLRT
jgi:hypothetical protein